METFSALLAICAGNSPVPGEFPTQRPVTRSFDVYFDLRPDKRLSKQLWGWWFETLSHSLWRHRNVCANVWSVLFCCVCVICFLSINAMTLDMSFIVAILTNIVWLLFPVCYSWGHGWNQAIPLRCRHNERDGVSNHQPHHCLLNCWFRRRSKKTANLRVTGLCVGNSPVTGEFSAQKAGNAENVSIWWRHHGYPTKNNKAYTVWIILGM